MSDYGNMLNKIKVGKSEKYFYFIFILFWNDVKYKNVVLICRIITLKDDISSHYMYHDNAQNSANQSNSGLLINKIYQAIFVLKCVKRY